MNEPTRAKIFADIYSRNQWGGKAFPSSGAGSSPLTARPYVSYIFRLLRDQRIARVLDIGHGDWSMWPLNAFDEVDYHGIDVADGLSESLGHLQRHNRAFAQGDAVEAALPAADLVLCKDVLQHLPNRDVTTVLRKLAGYPRVVICHDVLGPGSFRDLRRRVRRSLAPRTRLGMFRDGKYPFSPLVERVRENDDCSAGEYRPLDLEKHPWDLSEFGLGVSERFDFPVPYTREALKRLWLLEPIP